MFLDGNVARFPLRPRRQQAARAASRRLQVQSSGRDVGAKARVVSRSMSRSCRASAFRARHRLPARRLILWSLLIAGSRRCSPSATDRGWKMTQLALVALSLLGLRR